MQIYNNYKAEPMKRNKADKDALRSHIGRLPIDTDREQELSDEDIAFNNEQQYNLHKLICDIQRDITTLQICLLVSSFLNVVVLFARIIGYL